MSLPRHTALCKVEQKRARQAHVPGMPLKGRALASWAGATAAGERGPHAGWQRMDKASGVVDGEGRAKGRDPVTAAPGEDEIGMGEVQRDLGTGICTQRETPERAASVTHGSSWEHALNTL